MTQDLLFLLLVALAGVYATRWTLRVAPLWSELPAKALIATVLAALVFTTAFTAFTASPVLRLTALIVGPLYVFGPFALVVLARARRYSLAARITDLAYWTPEGRAAMRRILAQAALQQGDADAALQLEPRHDALLLAQALALKGAWHEVLELELPTEGDNAFLGHDARIEALLALGEEEAANSALVQMRAAWEGGKQGPIGYRSLILSQARCDAEIGAFERVREALQQPLVGVRPNTLYAILGRAAERSGQPEVAAGLYGHAYVAGPEVARPRYAASLRALGAQPPALASAGHPAVATIGLSAALVVAFIAQLLADRAWAPVVVLGQQLDVSTFAAAFLLNIPGVAGADAWWRYVSYGLLHANLLHIGFNLWVLVDLGRIYEARRNWGNLLAAFVAGTVMGAYLTSIAQAQQSLVLVGASGGILGVAGALLAEAIRSQTPSDRVLLRGLLQWIALITLFSVAMPQVSLWGHLGGVVGGLLWGFVRQGIPKGRRIDVGAGIASILLLAASAALALTTAIRALT